MFNAEESLQHIKEMRYRVIMMKEGQQAEGIPPLELDEDKKNELLAVKNTQRQKEINV